MASQNTSGDLISDRYAGALYDLASESKIVDKILADLISVKKMFNENNDLRLLVKSPLINSKDKSQIFNSLLNSISANNLTLKFIKVIEKNKRFSNLNSIILRFININAQKRGDVLADITSAEELNNEQKNNITDQLKKILGEKLTLNFIVNNNIIGGLIVKVGSKMIDTSITNKVNKIKIAMRGL